MDDLKELLDRGVVGFEPEEAALPRLEGVVARRASRRKLGAAVVGFTLAVGAVAGAWAALAPEARRADLASARLVWSVDLGPLRAEDVAFGDGAVWVRAGSSGRPGGTGWRPVESLVGLGSVLARIDPSDGSIDRTINLCGIGSGIPGPVAAGRGTVWASDALMGLQPCPVHSPSAGGPDLGFGAVARIDTDTGVVTALISLAHPPQDLAVGPGAVWGVLPGGARPTVVRIDPETNQVVATIPLPQGWSAHLANGLGAVWVTLHPTGAQGPVFRGLVRIDPIRNRVVATVDTVDSFSDLAVGADAVWVSAPGTREAQGWVLRVDPVTNRVTDRIGPIRGLGLGIAAGEGRVWVTTRRGAVFMINPVTRMLVDGGVETGIRHPSLAVGQGAVWVAGGSRLVKIDPHGLP